MLPNALRATFQGAQEKRSSLVGVFSDKHLPRNSPCQCPCGGELSTACSCVQILRGFHQGAIHSARASAGERPPRMGISLARENVAALGAKWQCVQVSKSRSNLSRSLKTFNPRRTSHGSRITHSQLEEPDKASADKQGPFTLLEAASGERPSP